MNIYVMFTEYLTEWEEVDDEEDGAKDRALGNTRGEGGGMG